MGIIIFQEICFECSSSANAPPLTAWAASCSVRCWQTWVRGGNAVSHGWGGNLWGEAAPRPLKKIGIYEPRSQGASHAWPACVSEDPCGWGRWQVSPFSRLSLLFFGMFLLKMQLGKQRWLSKGWVLWFPGLPALPLCPLWAFLLSPLPLPARPCVFNTSFSWCRSLIFTFLGNPSALSASLTAPRTQSWEELFHFLSKSLTLR